MDYQRRNLGSELRKKVLAELGMKCAKCGFSDTRALQIDHVYGGGRKEMRKFSNRHFYYRSILNGTLDKSNYQVLCANCNWIKRYENNEMSKPKEL